MKQVLMVIYMALAMVAAAFAADGVTQVKTIAPTPIPTAKEMRSMFEGLRPEALQLGMGDATLIGATIYETLPDKSTRVTVTWHTLGLKTNSATEQLKSPLTSQFRLSDKTVEANSIFSIRGDLDALAESFEILKTKMVKGSPRDVVKQTTNNNTENTAQKNAADAMSPTGSGSGSNYAPGSAPFNMNNDQVKTDLITTQWQACVHRVDKTGGKVFAQARKIEITESGRVMSTGECQDRGSVAEIVKTYGKACTPVIDIANRKVYQQFAESATLDNKTIEVSLCTVDFAKFDTIQGDINGCGFRHDFGAGKTIQQEKLYYVDASNATVAVRGCGDSATAYAQFATQSTCTPTIDNINKQVFFSTRTAFLDSNGLEQYANDCRPDGNAGTPILEEFCAPKYEHDFAGNTSYYSTRSYYVTGQGAVKYMNTCSRSAAANFPHIKTTSGCPVRNVDADLKTFISQKTQVQTTDDGTFDIAACSESKTPIEYAYTGIQYGPEVVQSSGDLLFASRSLAQIAGVQESDNNNEVKTVPNLPTCSASGLPGGNTTVFFTRPTTMSQSFSASVTYPYSYSNCPPDFLGCAVSGSVAYAYTTASAVNNSTAQNAAALIGWTTRLYREPKFGRYLRGDGTYYEKPAGARFWVQAGCNSGWK